MAQKKDLIEGNTSRRSTQISSLLDIGKKSRTPDMVSKKELFLRREYQTLTKNLDMLKKRTRHLLMENEFLNQEAKKIQEENTIFASYTTKKAKKTDDALIRLSDYHQHILQEIQSERVEFLAQFKEKEKELRSQLLEKQIHFSNICKEVEELQSLKELQTECNSRIKELELEVLSMRVTHADKVHHIKSKFMQEKAEYEKESRHKSQLMSRKAVRETQYSVIQHILKVQEENCRQYCELMNLIQQALILKVRWCHLQAQNCKLREELEYREDLIHILRVQHPPRGRRDRGGDLEQRLDLFHISQLLHHDRAKKERAEKNALPPYHQYEGLFTFLKTLISDITLKGTPQIKSPSSAYQSSTSRSQSDKGTSRKSVTIAVDSDKSET